jgi:hypothetical protein
LFLSFSCCKKVIGEKEIKGKEYFGEWYSVETETPFAAILSIDTNYIFSYDGGACLSSFTSKGNWTLNKDTLILNSFEPEECYYIEEFGEDCVTVKINDTVSYSRTNCPNPATGNYYTFFENEKFLIIDSVLVHIRESKENCPEIKDNFTRTKTYH